MALQLQSKYIDESLNAFLLRIYGTIDAMYNFIYINLATYFFIKEL